MFPQHVSQLPRERSRSLGMTGHFRDAHDVLRKAGLPQTRNDEDLIELLLILLNTDEFSGPRERLSAMFDTL